MSSVTIWKAMNTYNAVLEPYCNFILCIGIVFVPILSIIQQVFKVGWYFPFVNAYVLVGFPELTCPCPYIGIHPFMQHSDKVFSKKQLRFKGTP
jgi:hypothetical protein